MERRKPASGFEAMEVQGAREMHSRLVQARRPGDSASQAFTVSTGRIPLTRPPQPLNKHSCDHMRHRGQNPNNPLCAQCGTVIIPAPRASMPFEDAPSISILDWTITTRKRPILNSQELQDWDSKLQGLMLPEMIFGNNYVRVRNEKHNWALEFNALEALKLVKLEDCGIRVSYAHKWIRSKRTRQHESPDLDETSLDISQQYDWTYTTDYKGTVTGAELVKDDCAELPLEKLSRPDPILFYDDMILFEDELADNGISVLNVKVRVMNECMLILSRFFLRVDDVLFRIMDTRVYVEFDSNKVIREFKQYESDYKSVLNMHKVSTNNHDIKAGMRDSNWVVKNLKLVKRESDVLNFAN
ncbi:HHR224Wp [Eremothecium sinecaudum]|uniref:HHR224Wp n=1 Tax=Eremothecium sinecaudum TaxID=45286 RepID=A0A109V0H5_9SACH|nr:HHR224Wp [Eremothecium sinecaudum]AMD22993.1 HHR224Wp [Eremothecium sinecaudum]